MSRREKPPPYAAATAPGDPLPINHVLPIARRGVGELHLPADHSVTVDQTTEHADHPGRARPASKRHNDPPLREDTHPSAVPPPYRLVTTSQVRQRSHLRAVTVHADNDEDEPKIDPGMNQSC